MKFATKPILQYPPHLRHVATLPWKIKKSNFSTYSADMDENANKCMELCMLSYMLAEYLKYIQSHSYFLW